MRTNPAAFALSVGMGLIVLLIGFLALNVGGLVSLAPVEEEMAEQPVKDSKSETKAPVVIARDYVAASKSELAALAWRPATPDGNLAAIASGDALFKNNCAQCHSVNDKVVGPALGGITKRRSISWLIPWVKNSSKVIASGDEYAVNLFNEYGKQQMPAFPQLSEHDIKDIIYWTTGQQSGVMAMAVR